MGRHKVISFQGHGFKGQGHKTFSGLEIIDFYLFFKECFFIEAAFPFSVWSRFVYAGYARLQAILQAVTVIFLLKILSENYYNLRPPVTGGHTTLPIQRTKIIRNKLHSQQYTCFKVYKTKKVLKNKIFTISQTPRT